MPRLLTILAASRFSLTHNPSVTGTACCLGHGCTCYLVIIWYQVNIRMSCLSDCLCIAASSESWREKECVRRTTHAACLFLGRTPPWQQKNKLFWLFSESRWMMQKSQDGKTQVNWWRAPTNQRARALPRGPATMEQLGPGPPDFPVFQEKFWNLDLWVKFTNF